MPSTREPRRLDFTPFVTSCGKLNLGRTHLFEAESEQYFKEKDSGTVHKRQKPPKLYIELMQLFLKDKSLHVVDACSGAGSCALACLDINVNCVILERCAVKARLICQRVKCS